MPWRSECQQSLPTNKSVFQLHEEGEMKHLASSLPVHPGATLRVHPMRTPLCLWLRHELLPPSNPPGEEDEVWFGVNQSGLEIRDDKGGWCLGEHQTCCVFFSVSEQVQSSKELIEKWPSKPTVTGWIGDWRGFSDGSKLRLGSHLV